MPVETTYTALREKLAGFLDLVVDDREVVIVRRRGARDVAIIAADELSGVLETATELLQYHLPHACLSQSDEVKAQNLSSKLKVRELRQVPRNTGKLHDRKVMNLL